MEPEKTKYRGREFSTDRINAALEILGQNGVLEKILAISKQYDSHLPTLLEGAFFSLARSCNEKGEFDRATDIVAEEILHETEDAAKMFCSLSGRTEKTSD